MLERQRSVKKMLSQADSAMTARHQPKGSGKPKTRLTLRTAAVCPATASQRSLTSVRRRRTWPRSSGRSAELPVRSGLSHTSAIAPGA